MSEWLTTGQMIDRLKVGEVAELHHTWQTSKYVKGAFDRVTKTEDGDIVWVDENGLGKCEDPLMIYGHTLNFQWRIAPNYVSFEEAMKSLKNGIWVTAYSEKGTKIADFTEGQTFRSIGKGVICFRELFEAKFTIEGDS